MNLAKLAAMLHVSPSSVSIVRQGKPGVSPATRRRIQTAMEEHGYSYVPYVSAFPSETQSDSPSRCIRLLKFYRSGLLANKNEGFVDAIVDSIDAIARARDYMLIFNSVSHADYAHFIHECSTTNCLGLLVIGTEMEPADFEMLRGLKMPVVILDCDHPALPFSSVTMNNRDLAYSAVHELTHLGEVGYLCSNIRTGNFVARGNGYGEAVRDFQLPDHPDLIFAVTPSLYQSEEDMRELICQGRRIPKALFADNDVIAIGAMRALHACGLQIPQDVSIIGVDNTMLAQIASPSLSSIHIGCSMMGQQAINLLLEQIDKPTDMPRQIHIGSQLIMRDSIQRRSEARACNE